MIGFLRVKESSIGERIDLITDFYDTNYMGVEATKFYRQRMESGSEEETLQIIHEHELAQIRLIYRKV